MSSPSLELVSEDLSELRMSELLDPELEVSSELDLEPVFSSEPLLRIPNWPREKCTRQAKKMFPCKWE